MTTHSSTNVWTTQDGRILQVRDMETSHIKNCIVMLQRNMPNEEYDDYIVPDHWSFFGAVLFQPGAKEYRAKIKMFKKELARRGAN